jgi:hypothetical protein
MQYTQGGVGAALTPARTPEVARRLTDQIQAGAVRKEYLARVRGAFPAGDVACDAPLATNPKTRSVFVPLPGASIWLENISVDARCSWKVLSDKCLNRPIVTRAHVPRQVPTSLVCWGRTAPSRCGHTRAYTDVPRPLSEQLDWKTPIFCQAGGAEYPELPCIGTHGVQGALDRRGRLGAPRGGAAVPFNLYPPLFVLHAASPRM